MLRWGGGRAAGRIVASGLFDAAWYRRTQAPGLAPDDDAVRHYLRHGADGSLHPGPQFDAAWYLRRYPDVAAAGAHPLLHYLSHGRDEGRESQAVLEPAQVRAIAESGLFDAGWYRATQAADLPDGTDAVRHYLAEGAALGLNPSPSFDAAWYLRRHPDVAAAGANPLLHYIEHGRDEGRPIRRRAHPAEIALVAGSGLFDADWYRRVQVPELAADDDPVLHYLREGGAGQLDPGPLFDAARYLADYADVAAAGENPLVHYLRHGRAEQRRILPVVDRDDAEIILCSVLFDPGWYRRTQVPTLAPLSDAARHYLQQGAASGLAPSRQFDPAWYLRRYPDVAAAGANPLLHYLRSRQSEGRERRPMVEAADVEAIGDSGLFDAAWYRRTQAPDLAAELDPIRHYLQDGASLGLNPGPEFDAAWYRRAYPAAAATGVNVLLHYLRGLPGCSAVRRPVVDPATMQLAAATGLFDPHWYLRTQAPALPGDADPLEHYLQEGAAGGLHPGPFFDGAWYLRFHRDVAAAGVNPLVHFAQRGAAENRSYCNVAIPAEGATGAMVVKQMPCNAGVGSSVAVMVHAFYPDTFEQLCPMLCAIPGGFTLLVAVGTQAGRQTVERAVRRAGLAARLVCRIVPNRGRNFGSFLAEFPDEILLHDLVLHLHTKRSLYTGREQVEWRDALYRGLVGTVGLVKFVLGLFATFPRMGLFYPAIAPHLPYWAHSWLSNAHLAPGLFERLGVEEYPLQGYFDYPVGGMFWARVAAIRPLLAAGLDYKDFPPEAGQTDGTLAHAVERAIGLVSRARGFGFVEYDSATGALRDNWSPRNIAQYSDTSLERFAVMCAARRLISFDIFDTLLVRAALTADAVLHYVGHRLDLMAGADSPGGNFLTRRKRAEALARTVRNDAGDVDIDDIYAAFAADAAWTAERIAAAKSLERSTDAGSLRIRPGAADLLRVARASGARIIAMSDTYYTRADIDTLLGSAGIGTPFDAVYISSQEGARKDRGDLWDRVAAQEGVEGEDWLHVGDNEHSDIQAACDRGIGFFHVMAPGSLLEFDGFRRAATAGPPRWGAELIVGPAMLRIAGSPFRVRSAAGAVSLRDARETGYVVFGPVIFLFMSWLIRHPALHHVRHLYFLAREGFLLHRVYEAIRARFPGLPIPPGSYFYTSRRSTLAAVQARAFLPERILGGAGFTGTMQELLQNRIGLDLPADFAADQWNIRLPHDLGASIAALNVLERPIVAHAATEADCLIEYGREVGMEQPGLCGVVDIGYAATIQTNLQIVMQRPLVGFYMGCHDAAQQVEGQNGIAFGCFAEDVVQWTSESPVLRHSLLMEAFLTAPHGQLLSFARVGAAVVPVFKPHSMTSNEERLLADLHGGAMDYVQELLDIYGSDLLLADSELTMPQEFVRLLMDRRLALPPELANMFRVEDEFCGNGELAVAL